MKLAVVFVPTLAIAATINLPGFRGPDHLGVGVGKAPTAVSAAGKAPLKVGIYSDGDLADDNGERSWMIYCLDKSTGKILWQRVATKSLPKTKRHTKATHNNATPVTDGKRVVAFFGSQGVYACDLDGKLLWSKGLGTFDIGPVGYDLRWGTASSPVLFEDKLVLQCDQKQGGFLVQLNVADGEEIWRTSREPIATQSWATPAVVRAAGRTQIVSNGWPYIAGYDFTSGKELWRLKSPGDIPVPTPIFANGLIYVTNAHSRPTPLFAIQPDAHGDISPQGTATSGDGLAWYSQRLGAATTGFSASPIAVDSKILFTSEDGEVFVVKAGLQFELLSKNLIGEISTASPAFSEDTIFYRTQGHVVAIRGN